MPRRIHLDQAYLDRIKKIQKDMAVQLTDKPPKQIPCVFCGGRTIDKYDDLKGHFTAFCTRCGQIGIYNAADYRRYPSCYARPRRRQVYNAHN